MKKLLAFVLMIVAIGCSDPESLIQKTTINAGQLQAVLTNNQDFVNLVSELRKQNAEMNKAIAGLTTEKRTRLTGIVRKYSDILSMSEVDLNEFRFVSIEAKPAPHFLAVLNSLNLKYNFKFEDLNTLILSSTGSEISGKTEVMDPCIANCNQLSETFYLTRFYSCYGEMQGTGQTTSQITSYCDTQAENYQMSFKIGCYAGCAYGNNP